MSEERRICDIKDLKVGKYVIIDDIPCRVSSMVHSKAGKHGGAKFRIEAIGIFDGQKKNLMQPSGSNVDVPVINKRPAQVLAVVGSNVQLMDLENYETFDLPIPDDVTGVSEGKEVLYMEVMGRRKILQVKAE